MGTRGVYLLRCPIMGLIFLDGAADVEAEWDVIQQALAQGLHPNRLLQNYYNVYGWTSISREILYIVASDEDPVAIADNFRGGSYRLNVWPTPDTRIFGLKAEAPAEPEQEVQHMEIGDTAAGSQE